MWLSIVNKEKKKSNTYLPNTHEHAHTYTHASSFTRINNDTHT